MRIGHLFMQGFLFRIMWELTQAGKKGWSGEVVIQHDITKIQNYGQDIEYDTHEAEQYARVRNVYYVKLR